MARLVTKFKYLKPRSEKSIGGYAKYIATREGVEKIDDSARYASASIRQKELIQKILRDFPDAKHMLEYEDFLSKPNVENASEFISRTLEDNAANAVNRKTYADYIATRPRAQRFGSHGLFTDDGVTVKLDEVSAALNQYTGNVWTIILSLRREDAERLGYNCGERWRDMLRTQVEQFSKNFKIPLSNLRWYASFHNESHHPHVHVIVYSAVPEEGYLSKKGIENLRSSFAKDIFAQDLLSVYEKKNGYRDELRSVSRERIAEILSQMASNAYTNPELEQQLILLAQKFSKTSGKKVYGYLPPNTKALVDSIVDMLSRDERITELYDLWYTKQEEVISVYTEHLPKRVPLSQNPEFKPVRNAVIREALKIPIERIDVPVSHVERKESTVDDATKPFPKPDIPGDRNGSNGDSDGDADDPDDDVSRKESKAAPVPPQYNAAPSRPTASYALRLMQQLARIFEEKLETDQNKRITIDRKLRREIAEKKEALGMKMG